MNNKFEIERRNVLSEKELAIRLEKDVGPKTTHRMRTNEQAKKDFETFNKMIREGK